MVEEDPGSSADKIHSEKYKIIECNFFYELVARNEDAILTDGTVGKYASSINIRDENVTEDGKGGIGYGRNYPFIGTRLYKLDGRKEEIASSMCNRCGLNNGSVKQLTGELKEFIRLEDLLAKKIIYNNNGNGNGGNSSSKVKKTTHPATA